MIDLFGKKLKGTTTEIQAHKNYVFILQAKDAEDFTKQAQLVKESCQQYGIGGIVLNRPMTVLDIERLAALEHEQWVVWSKDLAEKEHISPERLARWAKYWVPYEQLPEDVKDQDRELAVRILELK